VPEDSQASLPHQPLNERHLSTRTPISPFGWVMILMLFILGAINFADKAVLGLAALPIIKELHLSPLQYGVVSGSLFWLFSLSSMLVTPWADVVGTKRILALLATTWALAQFAIVFITSFLGLLLARVVLGAGEGPSFGTSVTSASKWLPPDRRAFGLGIVSFGNSIGPAVFAPLLTFVIVLVGWRAAFALLGILGILWVLAWLLIARERPVELDMPVVKTGAARERVRWSPIFRIIFSRTIVCSILVAFSIYWSTALLLNWTPIYLVSVRHLALTNPIYLLGVSLPWILQGLALIFFGALADRLLRLTGSMRRSRVLLIGALLMLSSVSLYAAVNVPLALGSVLLLALAAMAGAAIPMLASILLDVTPEAHRGFTLGIAVGLATLSGFISPLVTGLMIQAAGSNVMQGLYYAYILAALFMLACNVLFVVVVRPDEDILAANSVS
jgi:ACS family hexuronate transporter-like MFS transporter